MDTLPGMVCSGCRAPVLPDANFCSHCGKSLKSIPPVTSVSRQIVVYLICFFLAPFGLWFAWKYLQQPDEKSKMIGIAAVGLTIVSIALSVWTLAGLFDAADRFLNPLIGL